MIGSAPATSSADRPSPPEPARTGQTSADTGTATIHRPGSRLIPVASPPGSRAEDETG